MDSQADQPASESDQTVTEATADELARQVEAILMSTDRPLPSNKLADLLDVGGVKPIHAAIKALNELYDQTLRSFRIEELAGGFQLLTLPEYAEVLAALHKTRSTAKLTPASMETLAIIAYKQPVMRAEIEAIRGVASGDAVRGLMERRLVKIVGRAQELGRPMLYGTTKTFLEVFGLSSLKDLPKAEELRRDTSHAAASKTSSKTQPQGQDEPTPDNETPAAPPEATTESDPEPQA